MLKLLINKILIVDLEKFVCKKNKIEMKIFETNRLIINSFEEKDKDYFIELLSNPEIINPVPQRKLSEENIIKKFNQNLNNISIPKKGEDTLWGVFEKGNSEMMGLCALLTSGTNEWELGYRFRVKYWGKGYGTETTKGIIEYCFNVLNIQKITADVAVNNIGSVKILNKFMYPIREFYNEKDGCTDRTYEIEKKNWSNKKF